MADEPLSAADRAADRAYQRGQESSLIAGHIKDDDRRFADMKAELELNSRETRRLGESLGQMRAAFAKFVTEAETRAEAAKERAEKQVTNRTLILTAIGLFFGLGMLLIAGVALVHGQGSP